ISEEIARIDLAVTVDGRLDVGNGTVRALKIPLVVGVQPWNVMPRDSRYRRDEEVVVLRLEFAQRPSDRLRFLAKVAVVFQKALPTADATHTKVLLDQRVVGLSLLLWHPDGARLDHQDVDQALAGQLLAEFPQRGDLVVSGHGEGDFDEWLVLPGA